MFYVGDTSLSKAALDVETQTAIVGVAFSHVTISFYSTSIYAIYPYMIRQFRFVRL